MADTPPADALLPVAGAPDGSDAERAGAERADGERADASMPAAAIQRRDFLRIAGVGASAVLAGCATMPGAAPATAVRGIEPRRRSPNGVGHVVVIGAGIWGSWTAYHLRERGARVTLVDAYGPANSRATSGDETRGIRSSYGDRTTVDLWTMWAREAITRWRNFDAEYAKPFHTKFFHETGDVIMRATEEPFIKNTLAAWKAQGVKHEQMNGDEARKRWPMIKADDITIALYEPDAGVVRARHATQAVAAIAGQKGVRFVLSRARLGAVSNGQLDGVILQDGSTLRGDAYVFACGPWLRKLFPELLENRMRVPLGYVCYFGTPVNDNRFTFPNLPSYNFPGVTGWPALPVDTRGFRVRGAIAAPAPPAPPLAPGAKPPAPPPAPPVDPLQQDPDTSSRWATPDRIEGSRRFLEARFPALAKAPLIETRSCHYESSINRDFIIDRLPNASNAWIAGVGQAEGFKFGPVVGEYVAQRVLGIDGDPKLIQAFKLPTEKYES
jgi:glycine/D-amino acid oxidase-like deaminating enzyme